jgi:hypothetical protein
MAGTSLYADDVAIFVAPIKEDISCLPSILGTFGDATGSCANSQKRLVAPIQCDSFDLDDILQPFPTKKTTFAMRYLGLPLTFTRAKRADLHFVEDKILGRLTFIS